MKKLSFRTGFLLCAAFSGIFTAAAFLLYRLFPAGWLQSVVITFFTTFYHFAMRLVVGAVIPNRFDPQAKWFQPKAFEAPLYKKLGLKKWKENVPTYAPEKFSLEENSLEQIVRNMCQAEVVHEVIVLFSFLPLLFAIPWGEFWVFFITSLVAVAFESVFVVLQRYNRPRIMKLLKYQNRHTRSTK